jgi:hypothetical protein
MALQATPQSLAEVWNLPVGAFNPGMRQFEQMQQADQGALQRLASEEAYKAQERPLTLEQLAGQNRQRNAELPGVKARARITTNEADMSDATYDQKLTSWFAENRDKVNKTHFESAMRAGPMLQQLAEVAAYNPQSIGRIRDIMTSQGLGDYWNPQWDNASPQDISAGLYDFGTSLTNATPAMQKLMEQLNSKETIADEKNKTTLAAQKMRQETAALAARIRSSGGKASTADKRNLQQALTKAIADGDYDMAEYLQNVMKYVQREPYQKPTVAIEGLPMKEVPRTPMPAPPNGAGPKLGTKENPIKLD